MNSRTLKRQAAKVAYKKFKKNFSGLKKLQSKMSPAEKRRAKMDGEQMLTTCPPFVVWWEAVKRPAAFESEPQEVQEFIEENLEWDE